MLFNIVDFMLELEQLSRTSLKKSTPPGRVSCSATAGCPRGGVPCSATAG